MHVYPYKSDILTSSVMPTFITILRILMVPIMTYAMLEKPSNYLIITYAAFCFAGLAGVFCEFLAKHAYDVTVVGQLLGAFITKLALACALILLVDAKIVPPPVLLLLIAYNVYTMTLRSMAHERGFVLPGNPLAPAKTAILYIGVAMIIVAQQLASPVVQMVGMLLTSIGIALAWMVAFIQSNVFFGTLRRTNKA